MLPRHVGSDIGFFVTEEEMADFKRYSQHIWRVCER
jgi:hypothetical protein